MCASFVPIHKQQHRRRVQRKQQPNKRYFAGDYVATPPAPVNSPTSQQSMIVKLPIPTKPPVSCFPLGEEYNEAEFFETAGFSVTTTAPAAASVR